MSDNSSKSSDESAESLKNRGNAALNSGDIAGAESLYRKAIRVDPTYMPAHNNLGNVLQFQGLYDEALEAYQTALDLAPDDYEIYDNIGITLNVMNRFDEAIDAFNRAVALAPDTATPKFHRSMVYLILGRWKEGLLGYESRLDLPGAIPEGLLASGKPKWDGAPLDGKTLLIYHEQGMGDMIQFLRYVPLCKEAGARVMVCCHPSLAALLATANDIDVVAPNNVPLPESFDAYISVMSLAHVLGLHPELPPLPLHVPVEPFPMITQAKGLKIGVCWRGNPKQGRDRERSISRDDFWKHLAGIPGVLFFSLQIDDTSPNGAATPLAPYIDNFYDTASLVQQLDLVISVCTSVAHLCGTLGVPTWLLLSFSPDWRWGVEGKLTSWYPSVRMFRQTSPGNWSVPLIEIRKSIESRSGYPFTSLSGSHS